MWKPSARARDGVLYDLYLRARYPATAALRRRERSFYRRVYDWRGSELIFDVGANRGNKAVIFRGLAKSVLCVEPSPVCCAALRQRFRGLNVRVVEAAVGAAKGEAVLQTFTGGAEGYNTLSEKWIAALATASRGRTAAKAGERFTVAVTTLDALISEHGVPAYIKIDTEGAELDAVRGLSQPVPLLSFECNLPEFAEDGAAIVRRLETLRPGSLYNYCLGDPPAEFDGEAWIGAEALLSFMGETQARFMEIYCKPGEA